MTEKGFLISSYDQWVREEKVPLHTGFGLDLRTLDVGRWDRFDLDGAVVNVAGRGDFLDAWVLEIPGGGSSRPVHHLFESVVYVLSGSGSTVVTGGGHEYAFEWGPKSMFAIPLNATYRFFNAQGRTPARMVMATAFPILINLFRDESLVFDTDHTFAERYGAAGDFGGGGRPVEHHRDDDAHHSFWETNFVPDLGGFGALKGLEWRGKGSRGIKFLLADGVLHAHMSEIPVGSYKKAHRHMGGTHIFPVTGKGYSLLWYEGREAERIRVDWEHGCLYSPPDNMFHQHFNVSGEPSRYFAVKMGNYRYPVTARMTDQFAAAGSPSKMKKRKSQIEYEDEAPDIRATYLDELAKAGIEPRLP